MKNRNCPQCESDPGTYWAAGKHANH